MNTEEYRRMHHAETRHWWYRALHARVLHACERFAPRARTILDVGCGTGGMLARLPAEIRAAGVDLAPEAVARCRERGLPMITRASADAIPFEATSADAVLLLDLLYHRNVLDPARVLHEVRRVLSPEGVAIINAPAYAWLRSSHDDAVHTGRRFTRRELIQLLEGAGFEVCYASYWNTILFPPIALLRVLRRWYPPSGSDVSETGPAWANTLLGVVLALEAAVMWRVPLPFGVSIFAVARPARPPIQPVRVTET
ncbi:MAG: class I SAM-dependent methyltransferase [Candidatus Hydrogenedentes bacterium]|nr:class I SAM-dependent methyltransferase [Candidatus Hydrogenedentota bacterium]